MYRPQQALGRGFALAVIVFIFAVLVLLLSNRVNAGVIGLSFQDTLMNVMGGMALQMERAIGVGDWIRIDGQEGVVTDIRWRHTSIETRNWDTIVIPNSVLRRRACFRRWRSVSRRGVLQT